MFTLQHTSDQTKARTGVLETDHGPIETPIFMPVGTAGSVKAVQQNELIRKIGAQIILGNTYHLYLRPGCDIMEEAGGLHEFMKWDRPILTDSGGYQIYSLSDNRELKEEGAKFKSHLDGSEHWFTPENVVEIQRILGSDIMMMLDECPPAQSSYDYAKSSMELTHRWAERGRKAFLNSEQKYGHRQFQFGIVQGGVHDELRRESARFMTDLDTEGIAIGGLSVGEPTEVMYEMTDLVTDHLPKDKARYLMGVGTPANLLEAIARGVDMFDCVMPTRNARNGMIFTRNGTVNIRNAKWKTHHQPLDPDFPSQLCRDYSMAYMHHLFKSKEILGLSLASLHNLTFYLWLMGEARKHIQQGTYADWYPSVAVETERRI